MASRWNYKVSSKKRLDIDTPVAHVDLTSSIIHSNEKRPFDRIRDGFIHLISKDNLKLGLKYLVFIIPLIAMFYLANNVYERQSLDSKAGVGQASLFFQSDSLTLPPDSDLTVIANSSGPVGFAKVELNFDTTKVKLVSEIDVSISPLKKVVKISSMSEANLTGKIEIILGLDPSFVSNPPSGSFQVAKFRVASNTGNNNVTNSVSFNTSNSQLVNLDQTLFNLTATNLSVLINPVATATPILATTPSPTTQVSMSSTPTPVGKDCSACHKRRCDNFCDSRRDGVSCPDCI